MTGDICITSEMKDKYLKPLTPIPTDLKMKGGVLGNIKCVLFDVYGTLFISDSGEIGFFREKLKRAENIEALFRSFKVEGSPGIMNEKLIAAVQERHAELKQKGIDYPEVRIEKIWQTLLGEADPDKARQFALTYEIIINPVYPMPALKETLNGIRDKGLFMGIISNAQFYTPLLFKTFFEKDMEDLGFNPDLCIYSFEHETAKPSESLYKFAVMKLADKGVTPGETLYVGNDMRNDIRPAAALGFQTGLFAGDKRSLRLRESDPGIEKIQPGMVITDLRQILEVL